MSPDLESKMRNLVDKMLHETKLGLGEFSKRVYSSAELKSLLKAEECLEIDKSGFSSVVILRGIMYSISRTGYATDNLIHDKSLLILLSNMAYYFNEIDHGIFKQKLIEISDNVSLSMDSLSLASPNDLESSVFSNYANIASFIHSSESLLLKKGKHDKSATCRLSPVITKFNTLSEFNDYLHQQANGVHMALLMNEKSEFGNKVSFSDPVFAIKNGSEVKVLFNEDLNSLRLHDLIEDANKQSDATSDSTSLVCTTVDTENVIYFIKDASINVQLSLIILTNYISNYLFNVCLSGDMQVYTAPVEKSTTQLVPIGVYSPMDVTLAEISFRCLGINPIYNWMEDLLGSKVDMSLLNFVKEFKDDSSKYASISIELTDSEKFRTSYNERGKQWGENSRILGFSPLSYGTKQHIDNEKVKVARFNRAVMLQHLVISDFKNNIDELSLQLSNAVKAIGSEALVERVVNYITNSNGLTPSGESLYRNKGKALSGLTKGKSDFSINDLKYTVTSHGERCLEHIEDKNFKQKCYLGKHNIADYIVYKVRNTDDFDAVFDVSTENPVNSYLARVRLGLVEKRTSKARDKYNPTRLGSYPEIGNVEELLQNYWCNSDITILIPVTKKQIENFHSKSLIS
jgi:hypothetical protein